MRDERRGESPGADDADGEIPLGVIPLHSTNLLTVLDPSGTVRYESPSIERIFGFDQDELVGESVAQWFHPSDREAVVSAFEAVVTSESSHEETVENRHQRADGSYLWVESAASADPTPAGNYVVNTRDVSARRAREEELERTNERLDAFAKVLGHDLRNPPNVAHGRANAHGRAKMVREEREDEYLADVARAHERMAALIDDLLTLARTGRQVREPEPVDLADLCEACWGTVETAEAELVIEVDHQVRADPDRLRQLLENVLRNAVDHGGSSVTVTVGALPDRANFYVADDGAGIEPDRREDVFERGHTGSETGTGFGLTIVREIAEAHGWALELVESEWGGTQIEVLGVDRP